MREISGVEEMRSAADAARCAGRTIGFVPTMGYFHKGHTSLIEAARAENNVVVVSIYVNPAQFGPTEDLDRYPRDLDRDRKISEDEAVDILFTPSSAEMYPNGLPGQRVWVDPEHLADQLCGASRPGHFRGVATVVAKLFNIVQPNRAYFGQKDAQQAVVISHMVADLAFRTTIDVLPTVREPDGLARSSRNIYLTAPERRQATALCEALQRARAAILEGERDTATIEAILKQTVAQRAPLGRLEYAQVVDLNSLQPVRTLDSDVLIALAVFFGKTRLIDNTVFRHHDGRVQFS